MGVDAKFLPVNFLLKEKLFSRHGVLSVPADPLAYV
jgi:hypothetical protein